MRRLLLRAHRAAAVTRPALRSGAPRWPEGAAPRLAGPPHHSAPRGLDVLGPPRRPAPTSKSERQGAPKRAPFVVSPVEIARHFRASLHTRALSCGHTHTLCMATGYNCQRTANPPRRARPRLPWHSTRRVTSAGRWAVAVVRLAQDRPCICKHGCACQRLGVVMGLGLRRRIGRAGGRSCWQESVKGERYAGARRASASTRREKARLW